jgi:hypothetical protein
VTRNMLVKIGVSLVVGAGFFWAGQRAEAHVIQSPFNNPSSTAFLGVHPSPGRSALCYVGWLSSGIFNGTTNSYANTPSVTTKVQSVNRCSNGFQTSSSVVTLFQGQRISAPTCSSFGWGTLSKGAVGVGE